MILIIKIVPNLNPSRPVFQNITCGKWWKQNRNFYNSFFLIYRFTIFSFKCMPLNVISLTQLLTKPFSSKYQEIQNDCRPFTITLLQNCGCCITNCFYHYRKERFGNSCAGFVNNNHINNELLWQTKMNVLPHQTLFLFWTLLYFPKIILWKYVITAFQHCHHYLSIKPTQ